MGFKQSMLLCKEIWELVRYHRWERFSVIPKEPAVVPVVQEFYASFRDQESRRPYDIVWETITVSGKEVRVTPREIYEFYYVPYYEYDFLGNTDLTYFKDMDMDNIERITRNNISDIEWMIRWIQEIGSIGQEFAMQNRMRISNLPLNKYRSMQFHHQSKAQGSEEEEESDDEKDEKEGDDMKQDFQEEDEDNYWAAFQSQ
ncbi:hypothetical protein Gohar_008612 [Gossypium harknessii]|uniref:Uncharacterized protein n=1 Tax=Gossypium harknessii TaxID=34285 RepID=A0A7J9GK87_9ROSI|nr:hypothetical protein [Gossypium harknessii]